MHSNEKKAAVIAALLEGQGVTQISKKLKVPKATVSRIKASLSKGELEQIGTKKKEALVDLVEGHLHASLKAATTLAERCSNDRDWFNGQSASEIAVLYGVLTDKAVRLLEAAQAVCDPEGE